MILKSEVEVLVNLPIKETFDAFTNPSSYLKTPVVKSVNLLRPGIGGAPNTAGALREINLVAGKLVEEIPAAERPNFMEYRFHEWPVPFKHAGGAMRFFAQGQQTRVVWDSAFELPGFLSIPFVSDFLNKTYGFSLEQLAKELKRVAESG